MIDIIVVTFNAKKNLARCLSSVKKCTTDYDYVLTVVDNGSTDGTSEYLRKNNEYKDIRLICNDHNSGFCGAANAALRSTSKRYIVLLDDDTEVTEGWLKGLYGQMKNRKRVGIVGGRSVSNDNRIVSAELNLTLLSSLVLGENDTGKLRYVRECEVLAGNCWLMRRELLDTVGYFDEQFFPSQLEDVDYCLRTRIAGYKVVYMGEVGVIHHNIKRFGGRFHVNKAKFLKKWDNLYEIFPLRDSHPVDIGIMSALDLLERKKFKEAFYELCAIEEIDERFSLPYLKGIALEGIGRYDEAIESYKEVLDLNPENFEARYRSSLMYFKKGDISSSRREADKTFDLVAEHMRFSETS